MLKESGYIIRHLTHINNIDMAIPPVTIVQSCKFFVTSALYTISLLEFIDLTFWPFSDNDANLLSSRK